MVEAQQGKIAKHQWLRINRMTKVTTVTFGCSLNHADSEMMLGLLKREGFDIVEKPEEADLVIVNSCTVKHLAEKKFWKALQEWRQKGKKVVVAGCVAQAHQEYLTSRLKEESVIGTRQIKNIIPVVKATLEGKVVHAIDMNCEKRVCVPIVRKNPIVGIVPLAEGCVGECTYCKTRQARGKLVSHAPGAIVQRVRTEVQQGCKEIWLTCQDCGAYGYDIAENIPNLLKAIMEIKQDFKARLGMSNPQHIYKFLPWLMQIYKENAHEKGKLFNFLHIPVQSGDNRILQRMKRKYTVEEFKKVVKTFRENLPDITIATDIIVGFPGETEEQFQKSVELVKEMEFDVVNVSRFWPRPGTEAAEMPDQVHGKVSKVRSQELRKVFEETARKRNTYWKGWKGKIIIDEKGQTGGWVGRNHSYKPVAVQGEHNLGDEVEVDIKETETHHLEGDSLNKD